MNIVLYLFNCHECSDEAKVSYELPLMLESKEHEDYRLESKELEIGAGETAQIIAAITLGNMSYSVAVKLNGEHRFSTMGFKKSWETPDPCIVFTSPAGKHFQMSLALGKDQG